MGRQGKEKQRTSKIRRRGKVYGMKVRKLTVRNTKCNICRTKHN
jgi:hypothetical protein